LLDVVGAGLLLTVCAPLMAAVSAAVRLDSPGPVIYKARRVGRDGRPFTLYKFRTMCADAEQRLAALSARNLGGSRLIRIPDDPRVTRLGRPLRRTGFDELPQLINVLRGEMSLVGPRPQAPDEVEFYNAHERQRLSVPPGITGLWQIRAWSSPSFDDWVRYDIEYIRRRSFWLDLRILAETPLALGRRFVGGKRASTAVRGQRQAEPGVGDAGH
jgi:lipopolysaccharide/colanic/teichoic acid biosynthesis glycosyltransferase